MPIVTPSIHPPGYDISTASILPASLISSKEDSKSNRSTTIPSQTNVNLSYGSSLDSTSNIPSIMLGTDVITDVMAARLSMNLLGHVLFLKSQVPL